MCTAVHVILSIDKSVLQALLSKKKQNLLFNYVRGDNLGDSHHMLEKLFKIKQLSYLHISLVGYNYSKKHFFFRLHFNFFILSNSAFLAIN